MEAEPEDLKDVFCDKCDKPSKVKSVENGITKDGIKYQELFLECGHQVRFYY